MIFAGIAAVSLILMVLFIAVTVAGGKSHDRQNADEVKKRDPASKNIPPVKCDPK